MQRVEALEAIGGGSNWSKKDKREEEIPVLTMDEALRKYEEMGLQVKYLPLLEHLKWCAENDSFFFGPMWGPNRNGKSSLALWQLYYIYGDWETALEYLVFTLPDFLELLSEALRERRQIPLVVWDDMGVHAGKRTKSVTAFFKEFSEMFDAIGSVLHGLIGTCIRPDSTVPALRERYLGEVLVEPRGHFNFMRYDWRIAYYLPGQPFFCKVWVEEGDFTEVPSEVYEKYSPERDRLLLTKFAKVYETTYVMHENVGKIDEAEKVALKRILQSNPDAPVRDDHLRDDLYKIGYSTPVVALTLAKIESKHLAVKRGQRWLPTPRGQEALNSGSTTA